MVEMPDNAFVRSASRTPVLIGIGVLVTVLIVWDLALATDDIEGNTWSELVRLAGEHTIAVPWLLGLVMGHWFHPNDDLRPAVAPPGNALVLLVLTFVVAVIGLFADLPLWLPLVVGAVVGAYLWPVSTNPKALPDSKKLLPDSKQAPA